MSHLNLKWTLSFQGQLYGTATTQQFQVSGSYFTGFSDDQVRLKPGQITNAAFAKGIYQSLPSPAFGSCTILNTDGVYDTINDYVFDGRAADLFAYDGDTGVLKFTAVSGTISNLSFDEREITVKLNDFQEKLERVIPLEKYLGNNENGIGEQGDAGLTGVYRNCVFSDCFNVTPILVNSQYGIWDLGYSIIAGTPTPAGVFLDGIEIPGTSVASLALLYSTAIPSGGYLYYQNYIRLYPTSTQTLTVDISSPSGTKTAVEAILTLAGFTLNAGSEDLLLPFPGQSLLVNSEVTYSALLNTIAESIGAAWFVSSGTVVNFYLIDEPLGAFQNLYEYEILDITFSSSGTSPSGVPYKEVVLEALPNYTVQTSVSPATLVDRRAMLSAEFRTFTYQNPYTATIHPLADTYTFRSYLPESWAQKVAGRLLRLLSLRRDTIRVICAITDNTLAMRTLGTPIQLLLPRFGYGNVEDGRDLLIDMRRSFTVIAYTINAENQTIELVLYGATRLQDVALSVNNLGTDYVVVDLAPYANAGIRAVTT